VRGLNAHHERVRLAEHEWFVLCFACAATLLWLLVAFVLLWDRPLIIAADDPGSWLRAVLAVPLWVVAILGGWLYANHVGVDLFVLGSVAVLSLGIPLGLSAIAWLRRSGV
jgi:hypothetical protein